MGKFGAPDDRWQLFEVPFGVFAQIGLEGEQAQHALRMLRSVVRGFVLNEMALSFLDSLDYQRSYELAIEVFIQGLSVLRPERVLLQGMK